MLGAWLPMRLCSLPTLAGSVLQSRGGGGAEGGGGGVDGADPDDVGGVIGMTGSTGGGAAGVVDPVPFDELAAGSTGGAAGRGGARVDGVLEPVAMAADGIEAGVLDPVAMAGDALEAGTLDGVAAATLLDETLSADEPAEEALEIDGRAGLRTVPA